MKTVFRYPGGKSKIAKDIIKDVFPHKPKVFVDVFAGGGSVSIEVLNNISIPVVMNDLDTYIYSFWKTLCDGKSKQLIEKIKNEGEPTIDKFMRHRRTIDSGKVIDEKEKSYLALFFNRTTFSGIFRSGPIGGYRQNGKYKINCRYNESKIVSSIEQISKTLVETNSTAMNIDFRDVISKYDGTDSFLYLDPPYMNQGCQLYQESMDTQDYIDMANMLKNTKCKWIVSHDNFYKFLDLFKDWANITDTQSIPYTINSIKDNNRKELLISNFGFEFNKRKRGRPATTNKIYSVSCVSCGVSVKTNPKQIENYASKNGININKVRNEYSCRKCRKTSIKLCVENEND